MSDEIVKEGKRKQGIIESLIDTMKNVITKLDGAVFKINNMESDIELIKKRLQSLENQNITATDLVGEPDSVEKEYPDCFGCYGSRNDNICSECMYEVKCYLEVGKRNGWVNEDE